MPCRSDYMEPTPGEHAQTNAVNAKAKEMADALTAANDTLREFLLGEVEVNDILHSVNLLHFEDTFRALKKSANKLYVKADNGLFNHVVELLAIYKYLNGVVVSGKALSGTERALIRKAQIEHREADLKRLMKVFADKGDRIRLRKVLDADSRLPLKPQLGFDADDF